MNFIKMFEVPKEYNDNSNASILPIKKNKSYLQWR